MDRGSGKLVLVPWLCLVVIGWAQAMQGQANLPVTGTPSTSMPCTSAPCPRPTAQPPQASEPGRSDTAAQVPQTTGPARPGSEAVAKAPGTAQPSASRTVELTDFQRLVAQSLGYTLPIYGASLFTNAPTTFAPVDRIPVTANYVVGPGDELLIRAWGQIEFDVHARVDRNGTIFIPKVGNLNVAGLKFEQLHGFLTSQISRIYRDFDLNVSMGDLRSIDVFVVGQAQQPGRYTVSALSTLANAIFTSGGPLPSGSMRKIQLKRGAKVVTEFDLYDLLIKGDKSHDAALQPEDVIYFPPVGPQVAVGGQVNTPAVYELKGETTLAEVIALAGGLTNTANGGRVLVEEILNRNSRRVDEVALNAAALARPMKDGDLVNVTALSPRFENAITLRGNVANPGRYPWHEGMRISDLIPSREFLITREYWQQQNQLTLESQVPGAKPSGAQNDVRRSAPDINWDYAVVQRMEPQDLSTNLVPFNLGLAILEHDSTNNVPLRPGDVVTVFSQSDLRVPELKQTKFVRLTGEFGASGVYRVKPGQRLRELVREAGGLTPSAYLYGAQFSREWVRSEQKKRLDQLITEAEKSLNRRAAQLATTATSPTEVTSGNAAIEAERANLDVLRRIQPDGRVVLNLHPDDTTVDAIPDLALEDGDEFYVPSTPATVTVIGDVYNQGAFIREPGKTVNSYLRNAGGPTRDADKGRIFVVRANGGVVNKDASSSFWSGGFDSMILMPGDAIIVPEQTDKGSFLRGLKDWSTILFNFGLAAAAIKVLSP
ncbi:MAG TPA: SLBB domain-containing protein [Candidatus Bathyarchaeia archaeon]|nr:SLBB domain-containing protein [Candidatus Bathyarchaeia archaeon]